MPYRRAVRAKLSLALLIPPLLWLFVPLEWDPERATLRDWQYSLHLILLITSIACLMAIPFAFHVSRKGFASWISWIHVTCRLDREPRA
jgi:hypothetical protein